MKREKAVAVGNRAGVVEWANAAWSRVTGYPLEDAIAKPIGDLLGTAGIEGDVIDFVRRRFERGEPCEIELPLHPPGRAPRWIHVSVESLRDRHGEVSHFAAIAWDVTEEKRAEAEAPRAEAEAPRAEAEAPRAEAETRRAEAETRRAEAETRRAEAETRRAEAETRRATPEPPPRPTRDADLRLRTTDPSVFVAEIAERHAARSPFRTTLDLGLAEGLPWVGVDRERVEATVAALLDDAVAAIGDEWGTVSLNTGVAHSEAVFVSPTYPRNCLLRDLPEGMYVFVEIHDTGPPVDRTAVAALSGAELPASAAGRAAGLAAARVLLRSHGGELRIDADPGFGTRVILLFPC